MSIRVALHHRTSYRYDRLVTLSPQIVRLRPAPHSRTPIEAYQLSVEPSEHFCNWQQDPQGNWLARLVFPKPSDRFIVTVDLVADLTVINPFDFFLEDSAEHWPFAYAAEAARELRPYLELLPDCPRLDAYLRDLAPARQRTVDLLVALNRRLWQDIRYIIRLEPGVQTPDETLEKRSGSCRDSAWLLVQLLRRLGIAARFCSGYLIQLVADQPPLEGPAGPERDFTDLHAWCEAYLPGAGWVGLDPTSGLLTGEGHIPLAATADPQTAAPVSGTYAFTPRHEGDVCACDFQVEMRVTRVHEDPRVTKPYTAEQSAAIHALGLAVDARLRDDDVRLVMGGEPTFVSIDDFDSPEWNVSALGDHKRERANELVRRLRARFAPQGALVCGQGKWYPGEQLPRWAFSVWWRRDGEAVWRDARWIADERRPAGHGLADAERFLTALTKRLGIGMQTVQAGYEDAWYHLWRERRLPINVDPFESRLEDPLERARLARIFRQGLATPVGYALPLTHDGVHWRTGQWFLREERLYLIPGDSPMGYRLPLDSLPWVAPEDREPWVEPDPSVPRPPLAPAPLIVQETLSPPPAAGQSARGQVRTALCVEPRQGVLHVFLPPLPSAEAWLALVAAVEDTARDVGLPVQLEGYTPPWDPRLLSFSVTPDPGVIEVNIHPAFDWQEAVAITRGLYEEARLSRLTAEKFLIDGRHTGTGGGNHITLGGPSPLESPFLRRPDLLASLVAYWHNHPSLSYLFSGLFIGPTSQAPRADEARTETAYELETALRLARTASSERPWLVDRIFRHLLVDLTGNTHRAEFSIDKLYSPDHAGGRRGIVELRAFEMPPHPEMSLAQQLLTRALVARCWRAPYVQPLIDWGTALHDRWLLPWFVWDDFLDVCQDLRDHGIAIDSAWFAPHFEFRFPVAGRITHRSLTLELRTAAEPWPVLGEEVLASGTARFVDSSLERLQIRLDGGTPGRHLVTVNGHPLPLHPVGSGGTMVAGLRFRAWQPPSCLHPTVGVHTPLVIDIVDGWSARAVAGCTYHVAHPGGRNYQTRPVNAREAEARRAARFQPFGFAPGPRAVVAPEPDPRYPFTLDLVRLA
ncbi:MAG: transglutaminase family protein [Planctomycetota bacterium]|nr:transglutaminase family protein [Planctomycetota bacterium]